MIHRTGTPRFVRVALAVVFLPLAARAQAGPIAATPADSGRTLHLRAGAGVDLNSHHVSTANALLGADWRRPGSRLSGRFDLDYFRREMQFDPGIIGSCIVCTKGTVTQLVGGSIGGQFDLTTTRFRPYVFSGMGVYSETFDAQINARCDDQYACVLTPGEFSTRRTQSLSVALHSGLGFSFQAGSARLFTEFRFQSLTNSNAVRWHAPVTFGVRF